MKKLFSVRFQSVSRHVSIERLYAEFADSPEEAVKIAMADHAKRQPGSEFVLTGVSETTSESEAIDAISEQVFEDNMKIMDRLGYSRSLRFPRER